MFKILIDTTERYDKSVKLIKSEDGLETEVSEKRGDIDIVAAIKTLLDENNLNPEDVKVYEPKPGPGSFTGLKIGYTITNIMNWALKKKELNELEYPNYGREPNIQKNG